MRKQLAEEGRIINPLGDRYIGMECLFRPKNMSPLGGRGGRIGGQ